MTDPERPEHRGRSVRCEMETRATPAHVWRAWADPSRISQWFADDAHGEAVAGGTLSWIFEHFDVDMSYDVVEAVPGETLVLSAPSPDGAGTPTLLEILIDRLETGTRMRLVHSGLGDDPEQLEGIRSGWELAVGILRHYLEHYCGEGKRTVLVMRETERDVEAVYPYFREARALASWLTTSGTTGSAGERVRLMLRDGGLISGDVLAATGREVAVSWEEENAVLELKAFTAPTGHTTIGMRIHGWGMTQARARQLERLCERSLARLSRELTRASRASRNQASAAPNS